MKKKNNESTKAFLSLLKEGIVVILSSLKYYVVDFSYDHIISDLRMRRLISDIYDDTDVGKIFINTPDFFILHPRKDPENGVFFVKCFVAPKKNVKFVDFSLDTWKVYKDFYPNDKIVFIVGCYDDSASILAGWMSKVNIHKSGGKTLCISLNSLKSLEDFVQSELKIKLQTETINRFKKELTKLSTARDSQ